MVEMRELIALIACEKPEFKQGGGEGWVRLAVGHWDERGEGKGHLGDFGVESGILSGSLGRHVAVDRRRCLIAEDLFFFRWLWSVCFCYEWRRSSLASIATLVLSANPRARTDSKWAAADKQVYQRLEREKLPAAMNGKNSMENFRVEDQRWPRMPDGERRRTGVLYSIGGRFVLI